METFETAHNMRNNDAPDYIVTKEEFEEYYNNVSASIDLDDYFSVMMNSAWNLDNSRVTKKGWKADDAPAKGGAGGARGGPPARGGGVAGAMGGNGNQKSSAPAKGGAKGDDSLPPMNYTEAQLMETFRTKLAARGSRGIMGLGRQFKIADDNNSKSLDVDEFKKCVHDFRIGLSP